MGIFIIIVITKRNKKKKKFKWKDEKICEFNVYEKKATG